MFCSSLNAGTRTLAARSVVRARRRRPLDAGTVAAIDGNARVVARAMFALSQISRGTSDGIDHQRCASAGQQIDGLMAPEPRHFIQPGEHQVVRYIGAAEPFVQPAVILILIASRIAELIGRAMSFGAGARLP